MTDPNWPRASDWLAGDHAPDPVAGLHLVGAPVRLGSISGGRFDLAPAAARRALQRFSTYDGEVDVRAVRVSDRGDLPLTDVTPEDAIDGIAAEARSGAKDSDAVVLLGGDNSITRGGVRGIARDLTRAGLVTLDAHHDLRDTDGGLSNGNPVRALLEDGLPGTNIVQIGIQPFANSAAYASVARAAGITVIGVDEARARGVGDIVRSALDRVAAVTDVIYVDLDVDVLDRAFAPACPGARPGGLVPSDLQDAARAAGSHPKVRAIDIVEVDPERDVAEATVQTVASVILAFAAGLCRRAPEPS